METTQNLFNWTIAIFRREFADNIGRKTYLTRYQGDYADAVAYAQSCKVYDDEYFTIEYKGPVTF